MPLDAKSALTHLAAELQRWAELFRTASKQETMVAAIAWYLRGRADQAAFTAVRCRELSNPTVTAFPPASLDLNRMMTAMVEFLTAASSDVVVNDVATDTAKVGANDAGLSD